MAPSLRFPGPQPGVLLIGHGTRDERGQAEFMETVRQVAQCFDPTPVEPAFLELVEPPIATGFDRLVERGARQIVVAPLLLFAAGHARRDIPAAVAEAAARHRDVTWKQADHLGCHPLLLDLSAARVAETLIGEPVDPARCQILLVGRGSRDPEATREIHRYAELLSQRMGMGVSVGFLAMAQPSLAEALAESAAADCDTLVVLPHLLFHGELLSELHRIVREWQSRVPSKDWRVAGHLGPEPLAASVIVDRCSALLRATL